tara:strand:- start:105 stop:446 length:342 start_codon:yes stop_codon:yes gene_type:complete
MDSANKPTIDKLIHKIEDKTCFLYEKLYTITNLLKNVTPESPCFKHIMQKLYILDQDIERMGYSIDKIELNILEDKKDLTIETIHDIQDEKLFQEMLNHFMPAMLFYTMCKNS